MKALKWIVFILIGLILAFLIFSALQDNQLVVNVEIRIDADADLVYQELIQLENWKKWDAFNELDSNMETKASTDEKINSYEWSSVHPMIGNGKRMIQTLQENTAVQFELELEDWPYNAIDKFHIQAVARHIILSRHYEGKRTPFYLNFLNLFTEPMIKESLNKDMENFKIYVEEIAEGKSRDEEEVKGKEETSLPFEIRTNSIKGFKYISITQNCTAEELPSTLSNLLTELSIYLDIMEDVKAIADPIAIFHQRSAKQLTIEAAIPIEGEAIESNEIKVGKLPSTQVIQGVYYGSYENAEEVYNAIQEYAKQQNISLARNPWETYSTTTSGETKTLFNYPVQ